VKARSLVFDLFGDFLRYRGGEVRLRGLIALMACFDVPEPTVRVVVARLRREGWAHEMFLEAHGLLRGPAEAYVDELVSTPATTRKAS
jgi:DNA-binding transcriptional regulator PaaX